MNLHATGLPVIIPRQIPATPEAAIIREVTEKYNLGYWKVRDRRHVPKLVRARYEIFSRIRDELGWPLARIGRYFKMHHTTVLHGIRVHRGLPPRRTPIKRKPK